MTGSRDSTRNVRLPDPEVRIMAYSCKGLRSGIAVNSHDVNNDTTALSVRLGPRRLDDRAPLCPFSFHKSQELIRREKRCVRALLAEALLQVRRRKKFLQLGADAVDDRPGDAGRPGYPVPDLAVNLRIAHLAQARQIRIEAGAALADR